MLYTHKTTLTLTLISLVGCYTKPMERTLPSLPQGVKESVLRYSLTGGTYKETLQRIANLRTVAKEWNKLLWERRVLFIPLLHATINGEPEAAELIKIPLARYLTYLLTANLSSEKRNLLARWCRPECSYYDFLKTLTCLDESQFNQDERLIGWPLLMYSFLAEGHPLVGSVLIKMSSSSVSMAEAQRLELAKELQEMLTHGKDYDTNNRLECLKVLLLFYQMIQQ